MRVFLPTDLRTKCLTPASHEVPCKRFHSLKEVSPTKTNKARIGPTLPVSHTSCKRFQSPPQLVCNQLILFESCIREHVTPRSPEL